MSQKNIYQSNNPPDLPHHKFNDLLLNYQGKLRTVRTQDIKQQQTIIPIARIKIPAPDKISSHLIKRFDTNAVSATSFFKSAFPYSTEDEEAIQMAYIHQIYDTHTAGAVDLGPQHRLTGVWVPLEHAKELAEAYGIERFAAPLIATPGPNTSPSSPTAIKNAGENEGSNIQTPKAKLTDHTQATRSSKRPRAGPLGFGNTSPSTFNLSSLNKPSTETKKSNATHESQTTNAEKLSSPTDLVAGRGQKHSPSKTTTGQDDEQSQFADHQLIGSDEVANQAKQEALKLVSDLRNSQANVEKSNESPRKSGEVESQQTSPKRGERLSRKRSVDEVSAENEDEDEDEDEDEAEVSHNRSFLPKLLWRRSAHPNPKKLKRNQHGSSSKSFAQLPSTSTDLTLVDQSLMSPLNPNKRNLAIAGIVIAGAAASIAPYFF